jgi:hypothetical protein
VSDKKLVAACGDGVAFGPIGFAGTLEEFVLVENIQAPNILLLLL